jgi:2-polyprenyl-3-methyl-5-hydroxy-6-metoxy-1,4-benzoquinol methylase
MQPAASASRATQVACATASANWVNLVASVRFLLRGTDEVDAVVNSRGKGTHAKEVAQGDRFEFGKNWARFLANLSEERVAIAMGSLRDMLGVSTLTGKSFVDIGSGSGLFSLAARRLGAQVHSLDYDPHSVACTTALRERFFPGDDRWSIAEASVLDNAYLASLGRFDVVYSWGVLHHTGSMWQALGNVAPLVAPDGKLFIAIYNDQGSRSRRWLTAKRIYNRLPRALQTPWAAVAIAPTELKAAATALVAGRFGAYLREWRAVDPTRGMSRWRDVVDWVGGYPYEYASADEIFDFYRARGFALSRLRNKGVGFGCVQYVFDRAGGQ